MPTSENPLKSFFRQPKFSLCLPSKGKYMPATAIQFNETHQLDVYAMTASDDMLFKAGDSSISGEPTYKLIRSCIPSILDPQYISSIDIDAIMLSIRLASYGKDFTVAVDVPNTKVTQLVSIDLYDLLTKERNIEWDEKLVIQTNSNEEMIITVQPIFLNSLFKTTKTLIDQKNILTKLSTQIDQSELQVKQFESSIQKLSLTAIDIVSDSVIKLQFNDTIIDRPSEIKKLLNQIDCSYFNAIKNHIENQRQQFDFLIDVVADEKSIKNGSPLSFQSKINFAASNFMS